MTKDTYLSIVKRTLQTDTAIKIYESHASKLAALGRKVEQGECAPKETVPDIEAIFAPFVRRKLREDLERALR